MRGLLLGAALALAGGCHVTTYVHSIRVAAPGRLLIKTCSLTQGAWNYLYREHCRVQPLDLRTDAEKAKDPPPKARVPEDEEE